jgi:murein DD-endopeptidase MepM/ murein hydrolase activator NlpD
VKKNKFSEFLKTKGYYVLLFVGVLAIAGVALIGANLSSKDDNKGDNIVDLNDSNNIPGQNDKQIADNTQPSDGTANNVQGGNSQTDATKDVANNTKNDDLLEYDVFTEEEEKGIDLSEDMSATTDKNDTKTTDTNKDTSEVAAAEEKEEESAAVETSGKSVEADSTALGKLSFNEDDGLTWPVDGNILMNYSMDHTIYYETLMQFKCNPAIIIDAEVDTKVVAAAKGIVTNIEKDNPETGLTVTMGIGDGYSLIYGQLKDVDLKVGDTVEVGKVFGKIAEPTRYYTVEGSNLYFQVLKDDETVNPMSLLR